MKKVLRYAMDDFLKYIERNRVVTDLATNKQIECDTVFQMDDDTYRVLVDNYLYDAFFSDEDIMITREDPIYLPPFGLTDIESRAKEYNRRLYLEDEQYGYIDAIYFLGEIDCVDEITVQESHEKILKEFEDSNEELSKLEMCERLLESYDRVNSSIMSIR